MDETITLTSGERSKMENEKQLYVLLKMINFTEKYYSYDRIDAATYKSEITKYIEKFNRFTQVIPNFTLDGFLTKYSISHDEVSWAKLVLEKGIHSEVRIMRLRKASQRKPSSSCRQQWSLSKCSTA